MRVREIDRTGQTRQYTRLVVQPGTSRHDLQISLQECEVVCELRGYGFICGEARPNLWRDIVDAKDFRLRENLARLVRRDERRFPDTLADEGFAVDKFKRPERVRY